MRFALAVLALAALAGCATGQATIHADGSAEVTWTRFGTDTAFAMTPDGSLNYSSNPSAMATQQASQAVLEAVKLGLTLATSQSTPERLAAPAPAVVADRSSPSWPSD